MTDPIKISIKIAIEIIIFSMVVGVLAVYIMLSQDFMVMNGNDTMRASTMRDSKAMIEYSMLDYATRDDVIMFTSRFRRDLDIEITQSGRKYILGRDNTNSKWDITDVREFLDSSNVNKYRIQLDRDVGDATVVTKANITVIE